LAQVRGVVVTKGAAPLPLRASGLWRQRGVPLEDMLHVAPMDTQSWMYPADMSCVSNGQVWLAPWSHHAMVVPAQSDCDDGFGPQPMPAPEVRPGQQWLDCSHSYTIPVVTAATPMAATPQQQPSGQELPVQKDSPSGARLFRGHGGVLHRLPPPPDRPAPLPPQPEVFMHDPDGSLNRVVSQGYDQVCGPAHGFGGNSYHAQYSMAGGAAMFQAHLAELHSQDTDPACAAALSAEDRQRRVKIFVHDSNGQLRHVAESAGCGAEVDMLDTALNRRPPGGWEQHQAVEEGEAVEAPRCNGLGAVSSATSASTSPRPSVTTAPTSILVSRQVAVGARSSASGSRAKDTCNSSSGMSTGASLCDSAAQSEESTCSSSRSTKPAGRRVRWADLPDAPPPRSGSGQTGRLAETRSVPSEAQGHQSQQPQQPPRSAPKRLPAGLKVLSAGGIAILQRPPGQATKCQNGQVLSEDISQASKLPVKRSDAAATKGACVNSASAQSLPTTAESNDVGGLSEAAPPSVQQLSRAVLHQVYIQAASSFQAEQQPSKVLPHLRPSHRNVGVFRRAQPKKQDNHHKGSNSSVQTMQSTNPVREKQPAAADSNRKGVQGGPTLQKKKSPSKPSKAGSSRWGCWSRTLAWLATFISCGFTVVVGIASQAGIYTGGAEMRLLRFPGPSPHSWKSVQPWTLPDEDLFIAERTVSGLVQRLEVESARVLAQLKRQHLPERHPRFAGFGPEGPVVVAVPWGYPDHTGYEPQGGRWTT